MFRDTTRRASVLVVCLLLIAGCAGAESPTSSLPTEVAPAAQAATSSPAGLATAAPPTPSLPTATLDLPTLAPTITAAPTATPFPLASGWWDNAVCYEVFVRSFYDSDGDGIGDLNGLSQKLDYINDGDPASQGDLGATCIWLMPIAESDTYHGYHVTDFYSVEHDYGSNDDFKRLAAEAHKRGIKIILDLVLNHTARAHPWFQQAMSDPASPYRDWYLWSNDRPDYNGPWREEVWHRSPVRDEYYYGIFNDQIPDLNYRNPAVTAEARKISAFWLNEMGADGFRLDAIKHLIENGPEQENTHETHAWLRDYRMFLQQTKPGAFTVGEIFDATPTALGPYYPDQLDEYFLFDMGKKILIAANSGMPSAYLANVQYAADALPFQRWAPFLANHDQDRAMNALGGDTSKAKIAITALLTLPGLPFLYYGEEIGMLGVRAGDGALADAPRRSPMQWAADEGTGGFTAGKPWDALQQNYHEVNVAAQDSDPASLLNLYRRLIHLHTRHPALGQGSFTLLKPSAPTVAAFVRHSGDEAVLVVLNFGKQPASAALSGVVAELQPGQYAAEPLLGDQPGAPLTIGEGGAVDGYTPLATLAPRTGYIFKLMRLSK